MLRANQFNSVRFNSIVSLSSLRLGKTFAPNLNSIRSLQLMRSARVAQAHQLAFASRAGSTINFVRPPIEFGGLFLSLHNLHKQAPPASLGHHFTLAARQRRAIDGSMEYGENRLASILQTRASKLNSPLATHVGRPATNNNGQLAN